MPLLSWFHPADVTDDELKAIIADLNDKYDKLAGIVFVTADLQRYVAEHDTPQLSRFATDPHDDRPKTFAAPHWFHRGLKLAAESFPSETFVGAVWVHPDAEWSKPNPRYVAMMGGNFFPTSPSQ